MSCVRKICLDLSLNQSVVIEEEYKTNFFAIMTKKKKQYKKYLKIFESKSTPALRPKRRVEESLKSGVHII